MTRPRVLLVDDKVNLLKLLAKVLGEKYEVTQASDGAQAIALLAEREFDVVLSDIRMPGADGFSVLREVKARHPDTEVVLMTAFAAVQDAVGAIKAGAYDYLQKPFDPDAAALVVERAVERRSLRTQAAGLRRELLLLKEAQGGPKALIGRSRKMLEVYEQLERAAGLDASVLLTGETGTGKELAARQIHQESARRERRLVAINCGALPAELVESELFGHARGAFTGAAGPKPGLFEEAAGGTIFLDEIGELPLPVQVKLNRALQEKEIRRVGETHSIQVDVRVISATHRDLKAEIAAGRFREDLYYRLHVLPIRLPPLRERREDVALLASHFLARQKRAVQELKGFEPEALHALSLYDWPGNVRELENAIERAAATAAGPLIGFRDLPPEVLARPEGKVPMEMLVTMPYREAVEMARDRISRDYLVALLREFAGNVTRAAERAGMERESLHRLMKKYEVRSDDYKA
jgi:DNA-binding NtrC family response regulator